MSTIKRRHFLQFAGSTLATLGLSHLDIIQQGNRYAQVLAQNTPRKLALLVGINNYPNSSRFYNLPGCVNDVDLQEKLLIYRFGFNPGNIVKLTSKASANYQPTRSNILKAFEEHLIKQAKPGDVVVFHFSGHGSRVPEPDPIQQCGRSEFNSTLVPSDDGKNGVVQDIMGRTLFLLTSALNTENVTVVLDSCHSGGGTRGNFIVRSVPGDNVKISPEEIAYQETWMKRLKISPEELAKRRCLRVAKGVVLASSQPEQDALDADFGGFNAGVFTYLLTQYLWQSTDNVQNVISSVNSGIKHFKYPQRGLADGRQNQPIYFLNQSAPSTDAVVIKGEGNQATLWLGGLDQESRAAFSNGATLTLINEQLKTVGKVELISPPKGLTVEAKLIENGGGECFKTGNVTSRIYPCDSSRFNLKSRFRSFSW
ncbi:peptidase C14 caspase catalytic subunit p20 [Calothrix brevissima NIES-22]|nr:peptidase C14 caspase catalytic subunit p20 [Calothrix brevissima NIES-22]